MAHKLGGPMISAALAMMTISPILVPAPALAQASEPFVGQTALFGFNFCPQNWAEANGQLLPISQYQALFALFGTQYGGDGQTTFALPELRGRTPIDAGQGPGLPLYEQGQAGGAETATITIANMPAHSHSINATNAAATKGGPGGKYLAAGSGPTAEPKYAEPVTTPAPGSSSSNVVMNAGMVGSTGGNQPISVRDPYLAMKWCVSLFGVFPSRS